MDSRTSSILLNLKLNLDSSKTISNQYVESKSEIEETEKGDNLKVYSSISSVLKECYLTGSLKYGNNFVY